MHILIIALAALGAVVYWIYRVRGAAQATTEIVDAAEDVRAAVRRIGYRRAAGSHPVESVEDARLAAAGMMAAIARMDGDLTVSQINALRVECRAAFRTTQREADDIAAFGRWLAGQSNDPEDALRRLGERIVKLANEEARRDLIAMMERVAAVENGISADQRAAIDRIRRNFGVMAH